MAWAVPRACMGGRRDTASDWRAPGRRRAWAGCGSTATWSCCARSARARAWPACASAGAPSRSRSSASSGAPSSPTTWAWPPRRPRAPRWRTLATCRRAPKAAGPGPATQWRPGPSAARIGRPTCRDSVTEHQDVLAPPHAIRCGERDSARLRQRTEGRWPGLLRVGGGVVFPGVCRLGMRRNEATSRRGEDGQTRRPC